MPSIFERLQGRMPAPMPNPFNFAPFDTTARDARRAVTPFDLASMGGYGSPVGSPGIETELGGPDVPALLKALVQGPGMGQTSIPGLPPQVAMGARAGGEAMPSMPGEMLARNPEPAPVPEAPAIDPSTMFGSAMKLPQPPMPPTEMEQFIAQFLPEEQGGGVDGLGGTTLPRGPANGDTRPWIPTMGGPQRNMQGAPDEGHMTSVGQWFPGPKPAPDPDAPLRGDYLLRQRGMQFTPGMGWHPPEGAPRATGMLELLARGPDALSPEEQMRVDKFRGAEQAQDAQRQNALATMQQDARQERFMGQGVHPVAAQALAGGQGGDNRLLMSLVLGPAGAAQFAAIDAEAKTTEQQLGLAREQMAMAERMGDRQLAAQAQQSANALQVQLAGLNLQNQQAYAALQSRLAEVGMNTGLGREQLASQERIAGQQMGAANERFGQEMQFKQQELAQQGQLGQGQLEVERQKAGFMNPLAQVEAAKALLPIDPQTPPDVRLGAAISASNQGGALPPQLTMALHDYYNSFDESWLPFYGGSDEQFVTSAARRFGLNPQIVRQWLTGISP